MSWRVRSLLINRDIIRRNATEEITLDGYRDEELDYGLGMYVFSLFDSRDAEVRDKLSTPVAVEFNPGEDYDDLLDVEKALKDLYTSKKLSIRDIDIINLISWTTSIAGESAAPTTRRPI